MRVMMLVGRATGGIGAHVDVLTSGLRGLGIEVRILTDPSTARHFHWSDAEGVWPFRPGPQVVRAPLDWHVVMRRAGTVDVVHAHGHQAALVAAVAVKRARPRPRLVVSLHNDLPPSVARGPLSGVFRWALRQADLVTGASADLVDFARSAGAARTELTPVASPRVAELLAAGPASAAVRRRLVSEVGETVPDRPLVLTISRIAPQKDLHTLVAAARASRSDASWVVIGEGDETLRAELEKEARGMPLHFVGARDDVADWLRSAQAFVLTSRWEARALVVQEAMAAGVPVVATRTGGLPDLIGGAGILVPVADPAAVAAAVDRLLEQPQLAAELGAEARRRAGEWETPATEARRWAARYTSTLGR